MLRVGGTLVFFSAVLAALRASGALTLFCNALALLGVPPLASAALLSSSLEMTSGCVAFSSLPLSLPLRTALCSFAAAFGGLSILSQTLTFLPVRPAEGWEPRLPWPLFVKTTTGGSSLRLGRATNRQELDALMDEIFAAGEGVLIEPQLPGKEITCGILGEEAMPPILIEPVAGDYFDYESKYASGGARELCPAPVSPAVTAEVQRLALAAHKALGLKGYSRADFILGPDDSLHLLEVNTLPGMTPTSLVPQEAAQLGMDFGQLLEKLIELGMEQHAKA